MPTKAELEDEINSKLGTELEWSRMTKADLEVFIELLDTGMALEELASSLAKEKSKEKINETIDDWHPGKILL